MKTDFSDIGEDISVIEPNLAHMEQRQSYIFAYKECSIGVKNLGAATLPLTLWGSPNLSRVWPDSPIIISFRHLQIFKGGCMLFSATIPHKRIINKWANM